MRIERESVRSILVIKLRAIGDVLLSTIVLRNLRAAFPGARIVFLTEPPARDVVARHPDVDEVIVHDRAALTGLRLIRAVRRRRFDLVIDLFGNPRSALVTRLSGARFRVGYRFRLRSYAYTVVVTPRGDRVHNTQFNLDALEAMEVAIVDRNLYFPVAPEEERFATQALAEAGTGLRIAVNAGGGWYTKRWGLERFAALADRLVDAFGVRIILPWGPGQLGDAERLRSLMRREVVVLPPTTLGELAAVLRQVSLMITNDSGPMHIAAAVGTPVLGIYGPTDPGLQGPYGPRHRVVRQESVPCLGCNLTRCPIDHPCMETLSVETVLAATRELMRTNGIVA